MDLMLLLVGLLIKFGVIWFLTAAIFVLPIYPKIYRRKMIGILCSVPVAFCVSFIFVTFSSLSFVLLFYLIGVIIYFFGPIDWRSILIWKKIFIINVDSFIISLITLLTLYNQPGFSFVGTKQSEAKLNLASLATAEISYWAKHKTFVDDFKKIKWNPTRAKRAQYAYFISNEANPRKVARWSGFAWEGVPKAFIFIHLNDGLIFDQEKAVLDWVATEFGIGASEDSFTAVAIGNIDYEPCTLDVWFINKQKNPTNIIDDIVVDDDCVSESAKYKQYSILFADVNIFNRDYFTLKVYPDVFSILIVLAHGVLWLGFIIWRRRRDIQHL